MTLLDQLKNDWLPRLQAWFTALPSWQKLVVGILAGILAFKILLGAAVLALAAIILLGLGFLVWAWIDELVWLMRQSDDLFPGQYDKVIWAALLVILPPVGMIALWAFRRSRHQESRHPFVSKPGPPPFQDWL